MILDVAPRLRDSAVAGDFEFWILNWGGIAHAKAAKDAKGK
jgi:hypothetical protein